MYKSIISFKHINSIKENNKSIFTYIIIIINIYPYYLI